MENPPTDTSLPKHWARNFFILWTGQAFSLVGSALVQVALVWYLTQKTGSATVLAVATLVALLPQIFLAPFAGALVDRASRRRVMILADSGIALLTVALMILFATGRIQVWHIYAVLFLRSLGSAFHEPAMTASTSLMVPQKHLTRVAGLNQTLRGAISIISPPLGAVLIGLLATEWVLSIDVLTAALAVIPLLFIPIPQPLRRVAQAAGTQKKTTYWQDLGAGFTYVVRWPGLLGLLILATLLNFLLSPAGSLLPLLVTKVYHKGALELGGLESALGVGVIVAGLILSAWGGFKKRILTSLTGVVGMGVGVLVTGIAPANAFPLVIVASFFMGFMNVFANGPLHAIFQSAIDPDMQGRVFALIGAFATAMSPLSLLIAGPVSDWLGVRSWYIFGGIACILMTLASLLIKPIMEIEKISRRTSSEQNQPNSSVG
jgi:DHA3 family macrolide efflux protein-like MFS transporter